MNDLISRQELLKRTIYNPLHGPYIIAQDVLDCPSAVENLPSVDAVEVVRCKDCIHFYLSPRGKGSCQRSKWSVFGIGVNGFCSYGERKPMNED